MFQDQEVTSLDSLILKRGAAPENISKDRWIMWYLNRPKEDYTFLLLEGFHQGRRLCKIIQFTIKKGTPDNKGEIEYEDVNIEELPILCQACSGFCYELLPEHLEQIRQLIEAEKQRAKMGLLNYVRRASECGPSIAASMEASGSDNALQGSQSFVTNHQNDLAEALREIPDGDAKRTILRMRYFYAESLVKLFVHGHNSSTWAKAFLEAVNIKFPDTRYELTTNPDEVPQEQKSWCLIF